MRCPFELSDEDLTNLSPQNAVSFFRRLLWAEASVTGISQHLVSVPQCINMRDGGLDARIEDYVVPSRVDVIPKGLSGYQIKASDLDPTQCKKEICVKDDPNTLKPAVYRLMENGGTYVLILFASIADETQRDIRTDALIEEFKRLAFNDPKVRVYTSTHLVGFANRFPSVVLSLRPQFSKCLNHEGWGNRKDVREPVKFVVDDVRSDIIARIRESLRNRKGRCPILRMLGLSGLGKTRLVYEALSEPDLSYSTIYSEYDDFQGSEALYALESEDELSAIIVIDECDAFSHERLTKRFGAQSERLALITISADYTKTQGNQVVLDTLNEDGIKEILRNEHPELPKDAVNRIAQFSEGYPKIAMLLSENIDEFRNETPGDLLRINDKTLIHRMIAGPLDPSSQRIRDIKRVLTSFSLFTKVGWKGALNNEAKWVASKFGYSSESDWHTFAEIVHEQKVRRVLQGEHFLYVTPLPLAVNLFREWLETQGDYLNFEEFFRDAPQGMLPRFQDRIPYMGSTAIGLRAVKKLLGAEGPFADGRLLSTTSGAELFHKLTEAAPEAALERLKKTIGKWDKETMLNFKEGRQHILWSLEMIAVWIELFQDAANLLLALGEAETERVYSNNASGIFCSLFKFGPGPVANTEASPEVRIPVLRGAFESDSKERVLLALRASGKALSTGPYTRLVGPEFQGAKPTANLWRPKIYAELFNTCREVWSLVMNQVSSLDHEIRNEALNILLMSSRGLIAVTNLFDMVLEGLESLSKVNWIDNRRILKEVEEIIYYNKETFSEEHLKRLLSFRDSLIGTDFNGLLKRYVGMNMLEDRYDENSERPEKLETILNHLAIRSVESPSLLRPHIDWLSTHDAENGYQFGYALGTQDTGFKLLETLLEGARSISEPSAFFLGGYLKALFEADRERWEKVLEGILNDEKLAKLLAEITWRSGITKKAAEQILKAAKADSVPIEQFQLFIYGGVIKLVPEETFNEWAKFLLEETTGKGAAILLDMLLFYYGRGKERKPLPKELTLILLTHQAFFGGFERLKRRQSLEYHWKDVALALMKDHPDTVGTLRAILLDAFGNDNSVIWSNFSSSIEALNYIAQHDPTETWRVVFAYLTPKHDSRSFYIEQWLRGEEEFGKRRSGALWLFNSDEVWDWVNEDIEERAKTAAGFVPPFLFHSEDKPCFVRELLCRYGNRDDVKRVLSSNFWSESWSGPESLHYMKKIEELETFKSKESELKVIDWIDSFISELQKHLERARIQEELEGK